MEAGLTPLRKAGGEVGIILSVLVTYLSTTMFLFERLVWEVTLLGHYYCVRCKAFLN